MQAYEQTGKSYCGAVGTRHAVSVLGCHTERNAVK